VPRSKISSKNLIGSNLRDIRRRCDISQSELATRCQIAGWDISRDTIAKIEGNSRLVADYEFVQLARILQVTYEELLDITN
jgi:transcriptional regulator with XRE-family HTH domain